METILLLLTILLLVNVPTYCYVRNYRPASFKVSSFPSVLRNETISFTTRDFTRSFTALDFNYHNYDQLTKYLKIIHEQYPQITALYSIGQSVEGRNLWVLCVTSSPYKPIIGKPHIKLIGNIHGNEVVGRELLLHLIEYLVTNYYKNSSIRWLLDNTYIHILPSMNPDGYANSQEGDCNGLRGRFNARGSDLNRNFPDLFTPNNEIEQPETRAIKQWIDKIQFILSASLHGGALVASYPFDNSPYSAYLQNSKYASLTPDNDVFQHLSLTYAKNHKKLSKGVTCREIDAQFSNGITNGAEWYPLVGGMQDYNYVWGGCMEVTLELSCCKYPRASELVEFWDDNRDALLKLITEVHRGVKGLVLDQNNNPIENAILSIKGRAFGFRTTKYGEFWRIILPGVYVLEITADGYMPREIQFRVTEDRPTILNVTLQPLLVPALSSANYNY